MVDGPALDGEDPAHGVGVRGVCRQPVHRLRRNGHQTAGTEHGESLIDVTHSETASRNCNVASMKPNASGVAKWSTLRNVRSVAFGNASASGSPGPAKSRSPITTNVGQVTAVNDSGDIGVRMRFITAVSAARSLPVWPAYCTNILARLSSGSPSPSSAATIRRVVVSSVSNTDLPMPDRTNRLNRCGSPSGRAKRVQAP